MRYTADGLRALALIVGAGLASVSVGLASMDTAWAHGPAPVALEVLAHDGEAPSLLRTNVGLARANGDGTYEYICPSRWDDNELALATASADGSSILVQSAGAAFLSVDAGCTFERLTNDDIFVSDLATTSTGFIVVAEDYPDDLDPNASHVFEIVDGVMTELDLSLPGQVDGVLSLAPDAGFLVSGHTPEPFVVDHTGRSFALPMAETSRLTPRASEGAEVWLRALETDGVALWHLTETAAVRSAHFEIIHGPINLDGRWLALLDGVLHEHGDGWQPIEAVNWTCLRSLGAHDFACSLVVMQELSSGVPLPSATPVFSTLQLGGPRTCGDAEQQLACDRNWAHFGGEPGWLETLPATSPTTERRIPVAGGCSATTLASGSPAWFMVGLLAVCASRRRR